MPMPPTIVIAGGSGFLGTYLSGYLTERRYRVVVISRFKPVETGRVLGEEWDGQKLGPWAASLEGATALVNVAGKSVNCLPTEENKRAIIDSRVKTVRVLGQAVRQAKVPPKVYIQASSLAYYGDPGDKLCDESAPLGEGFGAEVCKTWENEFNQLQLPSTRKVILRIGFVLGRNGGALEPMEKLVKSFVGGTIGRGTQYISWMHTDDFNEMVRLAIEDPRAEGVFNATGPNPVTNREFMRELRRGFHRPWSPPVPEFLVKLGAYLVVKTDPSLALTGRRCIPKRFQELGFQFKYSDLREALERVISDEEIQIAPRL
jgi:uncharacterized protein (TIGR01777 family)